MARFRPPSNVLTQFAWINSIDGLYELRVYGLTYYVDVEHVGQVHDALRKALSVGDQPLHKVLLHIEQLGARRAR